MIKKLLDKIFNRAPRPCSSGQYPSDKIRCPDCKKDKWYEGPSGGSSVNITCVNCGSRFNNMDTFGLDRLEDNLSIKRNNKIDNILD